MGEARSEFGFQSCRLFLQFILTKTSSFPDGFGFKIWFENFRREGEDAISVDTVGLRFKISSMIPKSASAPRAKFFLFHESDRTAEVENVMERHRERCGSPTYGEGRLFYG